MNRHKGILITIFCICSIGMMTTVYTNQLVQNSDTNIETRIETKINTNAATEIESSAEMSAISDLPKEKSLETRLQAEPRQPQEPLSVMDEHVPDSAAADTDTEETVSSVEIPLSDLAGADMQMGNAVAALEPLQETVLSPLGSGTEHTKLGASQEKKQLLRNYTDRLNEVENQIKILRSQKPDLTGHSLKAVAEKELKLWENEQNNLYQAIISLMDTNEAEAFLEESREWLRQREAKAVEAARKYADGTMESVEYTVSLAESTRARAYKMLELYLKNLEE